MPKHTIDELHPAINSLWSWAISLAVLSPQSPPGCILGSSTYVMLLWRGVGRAASETCREGKLDDTAQDNDQMPRHWKGGVHQRRNPRMHKLATLCRCRPILLPMSYMYTVSTRHAASISALQHRALGVCHVESVLGRSIFPAIAIVRWLWS